MMNWMLIEVAPNGVMIPLPIEYDKWEDACKGQEALEEVLTDRSYLIYSVDEWMYEMENGRVKM